MRLSVNRDRCRGCVAVKEGELYKSPADPHADLIVRALEEPGVLAGYSANRKLPRLQRSSFGVASGYVWVPLRIRVDLDRVHRQLVASRSFTDVQPLGSCEGPYKEDPWGHMTPFVSGFFFGGSCFRVSITDEGSDNKSSSGSRLFAQGDNDFHILVYGLAIIQ